MSALGSTGWVAETSVAATVVLVLIGLRRTVVRGGIRSRLGLAGPGSMVQPDHSSRLPAQHHRHQLLLATAIGIPTVIALGWPRSVALGGFGAVAWWARGAQRRRRAAQALERELPDVLDAMVGVLRSGGALLEGLRAAHQQPFDPSVRRDLGLVLAEVDRGGAVESALAGWAARRRDRDLETMAGLTAAATTTGGPLATALASISAAIRQRQAQAREVDALVSQARLSAMVLVVLPVGVLPLLDVLGAVTISDVLSDPVSRLAVISGVGLDLLGLAWMRRLVARIQA